MRRENMPQAHPKHLRHTPEHTSNSQPTEVSDRIPREDLPMGIVAEELMQLIEAQEHNPRRHGAHCQHQHAVSERQFVNPEPFVEIADATSPVEQQRNRRHPELQHDQPQKTLARRPQTSADPSDLSYLCLIFSCLLY